MTGGSSRRNAAGREPSAAGFSGPAPRAEFTLDKVPFVRVRGMPGAASLTIARYEWGVTAGILAASLQAQGTRRGTAPAALLPFTAPFVARKGPAGCPSPFRCRAEGSLHRARRAEGEAEARDSVSSPAGTAADRAPAAARATGRRGGGTGSWASMAAMILAGS